ncbi:MAG: hypothetical protein ACTSUH_07740 [Candidatus Thorarchaeota archaeon]
MTISQVRGGPFLDRDEILGHIEGMLENCHNRSVLAGLYGVGGYGKTAILQACSRLDSATTIMLDFNETTDFYRQVELIAVRATVAGLNMARYATLSDLRTWVITAEEPRRDTGSLSEGLSGLISELMGLIPGTDAIRDIFDAMVSLGHHVNEIIERRNRNVGEWLQGQMGDEYGQRFVTMLTKTDREHEYRVRDLFLRALVADLEESFNKQQRPILLLFDEFNEADSTAITEIEKDGIPLTEADLWQVRFAGSRGLVVIVAARELPSLPPKLDLHREDIRVDRLGHESCIELIRTEGIADDETAKRIVEVSHQNPEFIRRTIDAYRRGEIAFSKSEDIDTELTGLRQEFWMFLMGRIRRLEPVIIRAAFLPFFDRSSLKGIWPGLNESMWRNIVSLSFVEQTDSHWKLHDLVKELAISETMGSLRSVAEEIEEKLRHQYTNTQQHALIGMAISVHGMVDEAEAIEMLEYEVRARRESHEPSRALEILNATRLETDHARETIDLLKRACLSDLGHGPERNQT